MPSSDFGVKIHQWEWLDLMNDFDEVAALNVEPRPRGRAVQRGGDVERRARRAHGDDGQPPRLERDGHGHGAVPAVARAARLRMPNEPWDDVLAMAAREVNEVARERVGDPGVGGQIVIDLNGMTILLTGGTGSFGNAFVDRVTSCWPDAVVRVYSRDELKQSQIRDRFGDRQVRYLIGDVRDRVAHDHAPSKAPTSSCTRRR